MSKTYIPALSDDLAEVKRKIESELRKGDKTDEDLYMLIKKTIEFLAAGREGISISKTLPIYRYFERKYDINSLFMIKVTDKARAFYTLTANGLFEVLQIVLEIHRTHKEYSRKGKY